MSDSQIPNREFVYARDPAQLAFTVEVVTTDQQLAAAVALRSTAYARRGAPGAAALHLPEADDLRPDVVVLAARSKADRRVIGTIRIQPNFSRSLRFEESVALPIDKKGRRAIELMRLGVEHGTAGLLVTKALAKVSFAVCRACSVDDAYVAGRRPVDAIYRSYQFDDLLGGRTVELSYAPGAQHSILHLPIAEVEERWRKGNYALYEFMCLTQHPELEIDLDAVFARMKPPLAAT